MSTARKVTWSKTDDTWHSLIFMTDPVDTDREQTIEGLTIAIRFTAHPLRLAGEFAAGKIMAGCAVNVEKY